jgi:hypothetical protein
MSRFRPLQASCAVMLFVSAAVLTTVLLGRERLWPVRQSTDAELASLRAQREELSAATDETLTALRRRTAASQTNGWTLHDVAAFRASVPSGWSCRFDPQQRTLELEIVSAGLDRWPECLALLDAVERHTALTLQRLDVAAESRGSQRRLHRVRIDVRVRLAPPDPERGAALLPRSRSEGAFTGGTPATRRLG